MTEAKIFSTGEMDDFTFQCLKEIESVIEDEAGTYTVGLMAHCFDKDIDEADNPEAKRCYIKELKRWEQVDEYFLIRGAKSRETVLIYHGTFHQFPDYLFG